MNSREEEKKLKELEAMVLDHTSSELLDMIRFWHGFIREYFGLRIRHSRRLGLDRFIPGRKADRVRILCNILADREIVRAWLNSLSSRALEVVTRLAWFGPCRLDLLEQMTGATLCKEKQERYHTDLELRDEFSFLGLQKSWRYLYKKETTYVFMPICFRYSVMINTDPPVNWHLNPVSSSIPADHSCCFEASAPTEVLLASEFIRKGLLTLRKDGKPSARGLADLQKVTRMEEFFPREKGELKNLRANLVASFLGKKTGYDPSLEAPHEALRELFRLWLESDYTITDKLLPHLKIHDVYYSKSFNVNVKEQLRDLLLEMVPGRFYTIGNIIDYMILRKKSLEEIPYQVLVYSFCSTSLHGKDIKDTSRVTAWNFHYVVTEPLIKAFLFLAASIGMVELRYSRPENPLFRRAGFPGLTPFDGLKGVCLTPLGAYLTGASSKYTAKSTENAGAEIFLDQERLLLTLTGSDPIKELTLEKCMEKIGSGRYLLTFDSLFRECTTRKDIKVKEDMFRSLAGGKLPRVWKDFFKRAQNRLYPLMREPDMMVFRVADEPELMEILVSDPALASLILKVQGRRIAVKGKDARKLRNRLRKYGYLME